MITPYDVFNRLRCNFHKWRYQQVVVDITNTVPLGVGDLPFLVLSMVQKRDVLSYLVAIKSFARHANPVRIVIVCDPSIDAADRTLLRQQIPHVELREAQEFRHPAIPVGGCWERLHALCQYSRESYVVQLDADTVTLRPPTEVIDSIRAGTGFVLAGESGQTRMTPIETAALSKKTYPGNPHIQCILEIAMPNADLPPDAMYMRGCAAFTGFPQSAVMVADLLRFSTAMQAVVGRRWTDWGTEQGASNYLVANAAGTQLLPFPAYGTPDVMDEHSLFVHFIGDMRFESGKYQAATASVIVKLIA